MTPLILKENSFVGKSFIFTVHLPWSCFGFRRPPECCVGVDLCLRHIQSKTPNPLLFKNEHVLVRFLELGLLCTWISCQSNPKRALFLKGISLLASQNEGYSLLTPRTEGVSPLHATKWGGIFSFVQKNVLITTWSSLRERVGRLTCLVFMPYD